MVICPDCGKDVTDAKFCSNCGATLKPPVEEVAEPVEETVDVVQKDAPVEVEDVIDVSVKEEDASKSEANIVKKSKFCANCGREVDLNTPFCPQCGFNFNQTEEKPQTKFCQTCGKEININAEICPHCGVRVSGVSVNQEKSVALAAILSFLFPGLGHVYNGLTKKGISFIVAYIISAVLIFLLIGFVLVIIIWIWALIDSIKTTEAINRGEFVEDKLF